MHFGGSRRIGHGLEKAQGLSLCDNECFGIGTENDFARSTLATGFLAGQREEVDEL